MQEKRERERGGERGGGRGVREGGSRGRDFECREIAQGHSAHTLHSIKVTNNSHLKISGQGNLLLPPVSQRTSLSSTLAPGKVNTFWSPATEKPDLRYTLTVFWASQVFVVVAPLVVMVTTNR